MSRSRRPARSFCLKYSASVTNAALPFEERTTVFGSQRLTGALLDRLTHHDPILELNGESYRLKQSKARRRRDPRPADEEPAAVDPETGENHLRFQKSHPPQLRNPDHLRPRGRAASSSTTAQLAWFCPAPMADCGVDK